MARLFLPLWALAIWVVCLRNVLADSCNPLNSSCPPIPGLTTSSYFIDFTQQTTTPSDWIEADYATVNYGSPNGANFTFAKRYDAPYIWSRFYILFGRVDVVLQAAPGAGIITGAVMMSDDLDEIDWEWSGNNFAGSSGSVQTNYFGKGITGNYDRGSQPAVNSPQSQFHTYTYDWSPDRLIWSIDGKAVRTLQNTGATTGGHQYPQTPARLHLGLWCSGDPDMNPSTIYWGGGPTNFSAAPFSAFVKSVKITPAKACASWQYPPQFDGNYKNVQCSNQAVTLPCTYTVASGDNGDTIAKNLTVSFDQLKAANPSVNWGGLLLIGQILNVPGGTCSSTSTSTSSSTTSTAAISASSSASSTSSSAASTIASSGSPSSTASTTSTSPISSTTVSSAPATSSATSLASATSATRTCMNTATASTASSAASGSYVIVAGDYGWAIADKVGCSFDDLMAANPGLNWDNLQIGQLINIPGSSASQSSSAAPATTSSSGAPAPASGSNISVTQGAALTSTGSTAAASASNTSSSSSTTTVTSTGALSTTTSIVPNSAASSSSSLTTPTQTAVPTLSGPSSTSSTAPTSPLIASTTPSQSPSTSQSSGSQLPSSNNDKVSPITPKPSSATKLACNQDNCLRNVIDPRYSLSMHNFCTAYTTITSNPTPLPTFLSGCSQNAQRVSSACSCMVTSFWTGTTTSGTPAMTGPPMRAGTGSWKRTPSWSLKRSPLMRWNRPAA